MKPIRVLLGLMLIAAAPVALADENPALAPREILTDLDGRSLRLTLVIFSAQQYSLRVIDNAAANDTGKFPRLRFAMKSSGASAGCNGSFFNQHPFEPVGLMVADGVRAGIFDPHSWMQGVVRVRDGELGFEIAETFQDAPGITQLIQSGPWLVRHGRSEPLTDSRRARRTFICRDSAGKWAIGAADVCTLGQLSAALRTPEVLAALDVQEALNFDGGPSTGLWVKGEAGDYSVPDQWAVRNYVAFFPRSQP